MQPLEVIIHFVLVNASFQKYSKPKVKRSPDDKRGAFKVFENPVYSTFNFTYEQEAFDDLSDLMEYNVLNNIDTIKGWAHKSDQLYRIF